MTQMTWMGKEEISVKRVESAVNSVTNPSQRVLSVQAGTPLLRYFGITTTVWFSFGALAGKNTAFSPPGRTCT